MNILELLGSGIRKVNLSLYWAGGLLLMFTLLITTVDVSGRYFRLPLPGTLEICELSLSAVVVLTWAHTQAQRGHVTIDMLFDRLPRRAQGMVNMFTSLLGLFLAILIAWVFVFYTLMSIADGETTDLLSIQEYPFKFLVCIGALALSCQFVLDLVDSYQWIKGCRRGNNA